MSAPSRLRQFASNVGGAIALFFRPAPNPDRRPAWPPHGRLGIGALIAILVVVVAVVAIDVRLVTGARSLPAGVVWTFQHITNLGLSGWFLFPTAFLLLGIAAANTNALPDFSRRVVAATSIRIGFIFMAIAVPGLFVAIVKRLIGRARPFVAGEAAWTSQFLVWRPEYASFPSGHATTAFAAATAIGALWPGLRLLMWTYAVLIAISRVVIVAHHPSDVIAGAIAGAVGALLVRNWYASRRLGFAVAADGTVFRLPGPSWPRVKAVARRLVSA
jgi:undecaprenyl-diphosphatase